MQEHTEEDEKLLATRLKTEWPEDALYVTGKKKPATEINEAELDKLPGEPEILKSINMKVHKYK